MKSKFFTLQVLCLLYVSAIAQYRCIPSLQQHGNPGGGELYNGDWQNVNFNYTGVPTDTVSWVAVQHLYFPFYFNGNLVTAFKVSDNGILTFDTATSIRPNNSNALLPDVHVPNNSICIRGGHPANGYTQVTVTTNPPWGYSPTMQEWISWVCMVDSGAQTSHLWSIVLEQGTNNIYVVEQYKSGSGNFKATVGIQIDNSTVYMAPGSPNIADISGNSGYQTDNYYYAFLPQNALTSDGSISATNLSSYLDVFKAPYTLKAKFTNLGTATVTSLNLNYSVNSGATVTQSFSGLSVPTGGSQWLTFTNPFSPPSAGNYQFDIWADNLNTGADMDGSNDHYNQVFAVADILPWRKMMCEEFKGTWCANVGYWTPDYDALIQANSRVATSLHYEEDDANWTYDYSQISSREFNFYNFNYIPLSVMNGKVVDAPDSGPQAGQFIGCPRNVNQELIDSLRQLSSPFSIRSHFSIINDSVVDISGSLTAAVSLLPSNNCRLYVSLVEDSVYVQQDWSGETMVSNISRIIFPSYTRGVNRSGYNTADTGQFIGHPIAGEVDSFHYTYTITDTGGHPQHMYVVVFVQDTLTHEIYQSGQSNIQQRSGLEPQAIFTVDRDRTCTGGIANLQNASLGATSYTWLVPGAIPATSTQQNLQVTFPSSGYYDLTLIATNQYGSDTFTRQQYILAMDTGTTTINENFETRTELPASWWTTNNGDYPSWQIDGTFSSHGIGQKCIQSYFDIIHTPPVSATELVLPELNFSHITNPYLQYDFVITNPNFYSAYTKHDTLVIKASTDCGSTFQTLYVAGRDTLLGGRATNYNFYPDTSAWRTKRIDLSAYQGIDNVQIRFDYTMYEGLETVIWLDNINVGGGHDTLPDAAFTVSSQSVCNPATVTFTNHSINATSYQWLFPGGSPGNSTAASPTVTYSTAGNWPVTLIASRGGLNDTLYMPSYISVHQPQVSTVVTDTALCPGATLMLDAGAGFSVYHWSTNESTQQITISATGTYYLTTTDANACSSTNTIVVQPRICLGTELLTDNSGLSVYPNPANSYAVVELKNLTAGTWLELRDVDGRLMLRQQFTANQVLLPLQNLASGVYTLQAVDGRGVTTTKKLVIQQ